MQTSAIHKAGGVFQMWGHRKWISSKLRKWADYLVAILSHSDSQRNEKGRHSVFVIHRGRCWTRDLSAITVQSSNFGLDSFFFLADVFLFGHSAGGIASLAACVKLRGRVRGVYIYESPLIKPDDGRWSHCKSCQQKLLLVFMLGLHNVWNNPLEQSTAPIDLQETKSLRRK